MDTQGKSSKTVNSKLAISKSSSSNTKSIGVTTRSMSKKIKDSSQMTRLTDYSFTTNVAPVMVTNATTIEEQLASLTRAIEGLTKHVQEQDAQIAKLINKADIVDANHIMEKQVEAHDEVEIDYLKLPPLKYSFKGCIGGLPYILEEILPKSFEELATRAHDMELGMTTNGVEGPPILELRKTKEKQEVKKGGKPFSKAPSKESMIVNVAPFKLKSTTKDSIALKNNVPYEKPLRKLTLKEMQAR
ncbi:UNVERIFIED_CONTAM: hypothetical protein Slati_2751200 [Sesamum latifolium]|uniref:Ty3-gypsy retrotransposon protein n=1 Tax=Sesamum latifolium TaxID=2727402 RepID=A0AAW2VWR3_9LAMI